MLYSITRENAKQDLEALQHCLRSPFIANSSVAGNLRELADSIEEQVKPLIEEPTATFSVVKASSTNGVPGLFWILLPSGFWTSDAPEQFGVTSTPWRLLDVVEVLRVGIGEPSGDDQAYGNGQYAGFDQALDAAHNRISALRAEAITAERKDAYDKALRIIHELRP